MRCLPIPTGGKPSEWSVFGRKNLFSLPTGYERPFWPKIFEENFRPSTGSLGREAKLTVSENFLSPIPTGGFCRFWTKDFEIFFAQYPPCQKPVRWSAFSRTFSPTTYWREMGCLAKKIWNFFSPVPPLIVQAVLNERFSCFLPSVPTGQKSPFGLRNRKLFSFTTQRTWDAEVVRFSGNFFLPIPNGHMEPFWTKENKKALGKFSKAVDFFTFSWYNKW